MFCRSIVIVSLLTLLPPYYLNLCICCLSYTRQ